jgi:hypothetical protein
MSAINRIIRMVSIFSSAALMFGIAEMKASEEQAYRVMQDREVVVTVDTIDYETRTIVFKNEQGRATVFHAGPEINNLDQVDVGSEVKIRYYQSIAAAIKPATAVSDYRIDTDVSASAEKGSKPAGVEATKSIVNVTIDAVDATANTISFTDPEGMEHDVLVRSEEGKAFLKHVQAGDHVDLIYTEAVAISVEPVDIENNKSSSDANK